MQKKYPLYEVHLVHNLRELADSGVKRYGEGPAFVFNAGDKTITKSYIQFRNDIAALATWIGRHLPQGSKVAVIGENSYAWIVTYFAAACGGNVIVPLDRDMPPEEIEGILRESGTKALFYSTAYADVARSVAAGLKFDQCIDLSAGLDACLAQGAQAVEEGDRFYEEVEIDEHALAAILYTSGTTGVSKGVMLSHANIMSDVVSCWETVRADGPTMAVLPLHHTFGFSTSILAIFHMGYPIYINGGIKRLMRELQQFRPHNMFLVPLFVETMYKQIWDTAEKSGKAGALRFLIKLSNFLLKLKIDLRRRLFSQVLQAFGGKLEQIIVGGAPIDKKYMKLYRDFGINLLNGYGITECAPVVAVNRNRYYRDGSAGQVLTCNEVKIVDPDEEGIGEIYIKGSNVMLGYFGRPEETAAALQDGWFKSGDLGYVDGDGFLFITGRSKNLIILSTGKNIYPEELEMKLMEIAGVKEVIVRQQGDSILAEVYPDVDFETATAEHIAQVEEEVREGVKKLNHTLPFYKNIESVQFRDSEFEKTTTKKIKRK